MIGKNGKDAVKIGDILFGYKYGIRRGEDNFKEFRVAKIGRKYLYDDLGHKITIAYSINWYPQIYDLIADDEDPHGRYKYYKTQEAAERAFKAYRLSKKLNGFSFEKLSDDQIFKITEIIGIDPTFV